MTKQQWGKAWRAMIEVAPVRLVADDPIYEVLPAHLKVLESRGSQYEVVQFAVAPADDLDAEAAALRSNPKFVALLNRYRERGRSRPLTTLAEMRELCEKPNGSRKPRKKR